MMCKKIGHFILNRIDKLLKGKIFAWQNENSNSTKKMFLFVEENLKI